MIMHADDRDGEEGVNNPRDHNEGDLILGFRGLFIGPRVVWEESTR